MRNRAMKCVVTVLVFGIRCSRAAHPKQVFISYGARITSKMLVTYGYIQRDAPLVAFTQQCLSNASGFHVTPLGFPGHGTDGP